MDKWTFQTLAGAVLLPMQPAASPPQNIFYKDETIIASDQYEKLLFGADTRLPAFILILNQPTTELMLQSWC